MKKILTADSFASCAALKNFLYSSYNPQLKVTHGLNVLYGAVVVALTAVFAIGMTGKHQLNDTSTNAVDTLLYCLLFPGQDSMESVSYLVRELLFEKHGSSAALLHGLIQSLHEAGKDRENRESSTRKNFKSSVTPENEIPTFFNDRLHFAYLPASRLRSAFITLISNHATAKDLTGWPQALFIASHPLVTDGSYTNAQSLLKIVRGRFTVEVEQFCEDITQLLEWSILNDECSRTRLAGCSMLSLLYSYGHGTNAYELVAVHELTKILNKTLTGTK